MRNTPAHPGRSEDGFILIEILVSALVLVIASAGVFVLLQSTVRTQAAERHASEAYSLAQEDQARLATMRVEQLWGLEKNKEERTITLNKTPFTVISTAKAINDITSAPSCGESTYKVDYVEVTSVVKWTGMLKSEKARIVNKLFPSKGALSPLKGSLAISVTNQAQVGMPGAILSGGGGVINGSTDATGCAIFPDLSQGNYSLTVSGEAAGLVNHEGKSSEVATVAVVGGDTHRYPFEFDHPGTIPIGFKYRVGSEEKFIASSADTIVVNNTGMKQARIFGTAGGTRVATIEATPLFPFTSAYTVYAGSCASNNPDPLGKSENAAAVANVIAPAGNAAAATIQLPALELVVKNGATAVEGARVTLTDTVCKEALGKSLKRVYTTNKNGQLSNSEAALNGDFGVPWGVYNLCVSKTISGTTRRKELPNVTVQNLAAATSKSFDLSSGYSTGPCS